MKRWVVSIWGLVLSASLWASQTPYEYVETADPYEILKYTTSRSLVLFDLEDVVMRTDHQYGSEYWADREIASLVEQGSSEIAARAQITPKWNQILLCSVRCLVNQQIQSVIQRLQAQGDMTMGVTRKDAELAYTYLGDLSRLGVDFTRQTPFAGLCFIGSKHSAKWVHGALFTGVYNPLGVTVANALEQVGYLPSRLVYVSHKQAHLQEVMQATTERGIPFIGIRLSLADRQAEEYSKEIVKVQAASFGRLLSEEQSKALTPRRWWWPF